MRLELESPIFSSSVIEEAAVAPTHSSTSSDIASLVSEGVAAAQRGERAQARTLLVQATDADPSNADAWMWLASISEYPEELLVFLNHVLEVDPENERAIEWKASTTALIAKTFVQRGVAAREEGQAEFAMDCFDQAIASDEKCEMAWFWRALMLEDEEKKLESLKKVLAINPDNSDAAAAVAAIENARTGARYLAVQTAVVESDWATATEMLDEFLDDNLSHADAWLLRSHLSNSIEEKLLSYERVLSVDPANAFATAGRDFLQGVTGAVQARYEAAAAAIEAARLAEEEAARQAEQAAAEAEAARLAEIEAARLAEEEAARKAEEEAAAEAARIAAEEAAAAEAARLAEEESARIAAEEAAAEAARLAEEEAARIAAEEAAAAEAARLAEEEAARIAAEEAAAEAARLAAEEASRVAAEEAAATEAARLAEEEAARQTAAAYVVAQPQVEEDEPEHVDNYHADQHATVVDEELNSDPFSSYAHDNGHQPETAEFVSAFDNRFSDADQPDSSETAEAANDLHLQETVAPAWDSSEPGVECPFCAASLSSLAFSCRDCRAILSLSDVESMLASNTCDIERIHEAVTEMEAAWNLREFSSRELKELGIGHLNLKNFDRGLRYLQEAARLDPNDVILGGEVNAIAIRLEELRRQDETHEVAPKGCSILVVDDSATVRKLISNKLEKHGHTVICAADGVEAMEAIDNFTPELVLLDITMPRMDGYQVCKMIRTHETAKDVPVVMISGKDGFFDKVRGKMSGCTGYITKPFGPETLMKALDTYLVADEIVVE